VLLAELNKLAIIHLYSNGFDSEDLQNFTLHLSNPSTVAQQQKLELWRAKFEIAGSVPEGMGSKDFVRKKIWGLNDEEIREIDDQRYKEKLIDQGIENAKPEEEGGEEEGGEETPPAEEGEEEGGGEEEGEDLFANDNPDDRQDELSPELLMASDDIDDFEMPLYEKDKNPIKPQGQLKRALYNRSRLRKGGKSRRDTSMPKFVGDEGMLSHKTLFKKDDPLGVKDLASATKISESLGFSGKNTKPKTALPPDLMSALKKMTNKLNTGDQNSQILFEKKENLNEDFVSQSSNYLINNTDEADDV
jgi:hypothetical protein